MVSLNSRSLPHRVDRGNAAARAAAAAAAVQRERQLNADDAWAA
jgi:hypothetical protein